MRDGEGKRAGASVCVELLRELGELWGWMAAVLVWEGLGWCD